MLREESLHLSVLENNTINFFYVFVATTISFSFIQKDTIHILLAYIAIIPCYFMVLSKVKGIYKIGAYLNVFLEGDEFNWERRSVKLYKETQLQSKIHSFNYPFLFTGTFTTVIFLLSTKWTSVASLNFYEIFKIIMAVLLYIAILATISKNRTVTVNDFVERWKKIRLEELK